MNLETIFYTVGIIAMAVNLLVVISLAALLFYAWRKYKHIQRTVVARFFSGAATWIPQLALLPIARKVFEWMRSRKKM